MREPQERTSGEWLFLTVYPPGRKPVIGGLLLIDPVADRLYIRLASDLPGLDADSFEVLSFLARDLEEAAEQMGADALLSRVEADWSHTFRLGLRTAIEIGQTPQGTIQRLFDEHLGIDAQPTFSEEDLARARESLPFSPSVAIQTLISLRNPASGLKALEEIVMKDPAISAHLIRLANSALYSSGPAVRSLSKALMQLGSDRVSWHVAALTIRKAYSTGEMRRLWDHCTDVAGAVRTICAQLSGIQQEEITLAALVHDIGRLASLALGPSFQRAFDGLRHQGHYPVDIERMLCGSTHAAIGANLLEAWHFPSDITAAVKNHHTPLESKSLFADVLYLAETMTDKKEAMFDETEYRIVCARLGVKNLSLNADRRADPEFALLRFAASA